MVSISCSVNQGRYRWQSRFWWASQQLIYGDGAAERSLLAICDRNYASDPAGPTDWYQEIPHAEAIGVWADPPSGEPGMATGSNFLRGLAAAVSRMADDVVVECLDSDCFHFRPAAEPDVAPDEVLACPAYEAWHLHSLGPYQWVVAPYLVPDGTPYTGGHVPLVMRAGTLRRLLPEWSWITRDMLRAPPEGEAGWWVLMYALQAACHRLRLTMRDHDTCCIPPAWPLKEWHHAGHYCCDPHMPKVRLPAVDLALAPRDAYYDHIRRVHVAFV
jgi:hypothetical protein